MDLPQHLSLYSCPPRGMDLIQHGCLRGFSGSSFLPLAFFFYKFFRAEKEGSRMGDTSRKLSDCCFTVGDLLASLFDTCVIVDFQTVLLFDQINIWKPLTSNCCDNGLCKTKNNFTNRGCSFHSLPIQDKVGKARFKRFTSRTKDVKVCICNKRQTNQLLT